MVMQNSLERNHSYSKIYHFLDLGKDKHQGGNDRKDKPIGNFLKRPSFISIYSIQTHDLIIVL